MKDWKSILVRPEHTLLDAMAIIDRSGGQMVIVTDESGRILGTLTDGDVRRALLKGVSLSNFVTSAMNSTPSIGRNTDSTETLLQLMEKKILRLIPVVNAEGQIVSVESREDLHSKGGRPNAVALMAGGEGKRLYPLTKDLPKPLIRLGSKPILEIILENFISQRFQRFYISVNYKREMIERHFGDGSRWGVSIEYLRENENLGTAGSLGLIGDALSSPLIVMNGDLLTQINFENLLNFHDQQKAAATMCVRKYESQIPFGVVSLSESKQRIKKIEEKPTQTFLVNGGIYAIGQEVLSLVPRNGYMDMPHLFEKAISMKMSTAAFPIHEDWIDIGRLDDLEKARQTLEPKMTQVSNSEDK